MPCGESQVEGVQLVHHVLNREPLFYQFQALRSVIGNQSRIGRHLRGHSKPDGVSMSHTDNECPELRQKDFPQV